MALQLGQVLCLLKTCSKNESITNALLRVRFRQCINPHFASNQSLVGLQIRFRYLHPYNATNTKSFLPNPASYSTLKPLPASPKGKRFQILLLKQLLLYLHIAANTIFWRFLMAADRLRLVNIFLLRAKQSANV